jgi:hypothetical protein
MEPKKPKTKKPLAVEIDTKSLILKSYQDHLLEHGKQPASIFKFAKDLNITEKDFYALFNSFEGIEKEIWHDYFNQTKSIIESDEVYAEYSVREKLLSFYFTYFEMLQKNRSYVLLCFHKKTKIEATPAFLKVFKNDFRHYTKDLVLEGIETDEIASRTYLSDNYDKAFWVQMMFLIRFWINDTSQGFEKTDAAIEKSVNLSLDLVAKGPLDSMIDFAKFLIQNRKN